LSIGAVPHPLDGDFCRPLLAFHENRIAVRFQHEWRDAPDFARMAMSRMATGNGNAMKTV
jgi:nuclear transport factor 2 (NTF2) superfamily protein